MESLWQQLTRGHALLLIFALGFGGSFHCGFHVTSLSSPSSFIRSFINSSWHTRYQESAPPQTVTVIWSLIVSMFSVGGIIGVLVFQFIASKLGRKKTSIFNSVLALIGSGIMLTSKYAESYEMIIAARILYGCTAGLGQTIHLMYLGEISPIRLRGFVTVTSVTFQSLGKLSGQFFGLSEILGREHLWNVVLCVPAAFALLQIIVLPFLPEAPRYLFIEKGDDIACRKALQSLWGQGDYKDDMDEMLAEQAAIDAAPRKSPLQLLGDGSVRWQLLSLLVITLCNQMCGMPTVSIFSFDIFQSAGIPPDKIRYVMVGFGLAEITASFFAGLVIERVGRKLMFWGGYSAMAASWVVVVVLLNVTLSSHWAPYVVVSFMAANIIFFIVGPGGAMAALMSEIFLQSDRKAAFVLQGIGRWFFFGVQGFFFPFLINALDSYCFVLFACVCLLGCLYNVLFLPETKGKTILEISKEFNGITLCRGSNPLADTMETKL
ncbi:solute carrier family 2 member 9, like 1 [Brachionichthys hirsutus]|uniref:solute carrier family 2 member 9, like 1 n=1 Tax=Brachionichthys hirsutus TaxID=412623 RepID=UPI003604B0BD